MTQGWAAIGRATSHPDPGPRSRPIAPCPAGKHTSAHAHTKQTQTHTSCCMPCFISTSPRFPLRINPSSLPLFSPIAPSSSLLISNVSTFVYFFSPLPSVTCPPMASGGSAGALTLTPGWRHWTLQGSEETQTANSWTSTEDGASHCNSRSAFHD